MQDVELAIMYRGWVPESFHRGRVVVVNPDGSTRLALGDMDPPTLPRSALKPFQVIAMLEAGLDLDGELLALAGASHQGEPMHTEGALQILAGVGMDPDELGNTADYPGDERARDQWIRSGRVKESLAHNCSGKHAAMLRTCVRAGWTTEGYKAPEHPLQQAVRRVIESYCGVEGEPVTDGCTAPAFATTLPGLARGFGKVAAEQRGPAKRIADAYRGHPEYMSGTRAPEVALMRSVPGLVAKSGAEGVLAVGLPDGTGVAIKTSDGADRVRDDVAVAVLAALGHEVRGIEPTVVLAPALTEALGGI